MKIAKHRFIICGKFVGVKVGVAPCLVGVRVGVAGALEWAWHTVGVRVGVALWLEWAWHSAEANLRSQKAQESACQICSSSMPNLNSLAFVVSEISAFIRTEFPRSQRSYGQTDGKTDGHGKIDSTSDQECDSTINPDQEYIYFTGSETLPSACNRPTNLVYPFTHDESSITFYSTSNGYKITLRVTGIKYFGMDDKDLTLRVTGIKMI